MYIKETLNYKLIYQRNSESKPCSGFADADWGNNINDRKSVSDYLFKIHGCTVSW